MYKYAWREGYSITRICLHGFECKFPPSSTAFPARRSWGLQVQREARWKSTGERCFGWFWSWNSKGFWIQNQHKIQVFGNQIQFWANVVVWNGEDCDVAWWEHCYICSGMGLQFGSSVAKRNGGTCLLIVCVDDITLIGLHLFFKNWQSYWLFETAVNLFSTLPDMFVLKSNLRVRMIFVLIVLWNQSRINIYSQHYDQQRLSKTLAILGLWKHLNWGVCTVIIVRPCETQTGPSLCSWKRFLDCLFWTSWFLFESNHQEGWRNLIQENHNNV